MSKLLEGAKCWLSCLASSYGRLCIVGWENKGWRIFLSFSPLCVHLAVYGCNPLCHLHLGIYGQICDNFSVSDNLTYSKVSTIAIKQGIWLSLWWKLLNLLKCIEQVCSHSQFSFLRASDASCFLQWEPWMGGAGICITAPPAARSCSLCNSVIQQNISTDTTHLYVYKNQPKLPLISEVKGMILMLQWKSHSSMCLFLFFDANQICNIQNVFISNNICLYL